MRPAFNFHRWCLVGEFWLAVCSVVCGESARTQNFIVEAPTKQQAEEVANEAEKLRGSLAQEWLGTQFPNWTNPCPITAEIAPDLAAGGATTFVFDRGEVFDWDMKIQGSEQRVLDSVLPHEVLHTVFASYFRHPLPRWADEGACSTMECESEQAKYHCMLLNYLGDQDKGIAFSTLLPMKEYPHDVLPLYAEGFSLTSFLIERRGRNEFIQYVGDGLRDSWETATRVHYRFDSLQAMQDEWLAWFKHSIQ